MDFEPRLQCGSLHEASFPTQTGGKTLLGPESHISQPTCLNQAMTDMEPLRSSGFLKDDSGASYLMQYSTTPQLVAWSPGVDMDSGFEPLVLVGGTRETLP